MALKDLIAAKSALDEATIEKLVSAYVRFDANEKEIALTPGFSDLSNKAKVLIYLVAMQGWPYVVEEAVATTAKPSALEDQLGIPGGTLRPILKDLKDRHLLSYKDGEYGVRSASFDAIRNELDGSARASPKPRRLGSGSGSEMPAAVATLVTADGDGSRANEPRRRKRTSGGRSNEIADRFRQWVDEGFFDDGRTLAEVQARFHAEAIIIPQTSIPKYLLAGVRDKRLMRSMENLSGKDRWVYRTKA